jgi:23S rRNA (uracil1939-C5)-methyltransferase
VPTVIVTIEDIAPGGEGVAHVDFGEGPRPVFVRGAVPGDRMRIALDPKTKGRGTRLSLLAPGADRVEAPCTYAERCGGCDWMHLARDARRRAYEERVRGALPDAWRETPLAFHGSDGRLGRRTRARVHVVARASSPGRTHAQGKVWVGMYEARSHAPVEVDACVVLDPRLDAARGVLAGLLAGAEGKGEAQLALGAEGRPVLDLSWDRDLAPACFGRFEAALDGARAPTGAGDAPAVRWAGMRVVTPGATRPAVVGDPTPWMVGADGAPLRLTPGGFAQADPEGNATLGARVRAFAEGALASAEDTDALVTELHAGAGNFTVLLARLTTKLVTVERAREACEAARENLAARQLTARVTEGDADAATWPPRTRLLVLDPPRTGAPLVMDRIKTSAPRHIVYVSCDAGSLKRDLGVLAAAGYAARAAEVFEMFPETRHVEAVVWAERR